MRAFERMGRSLGRHPLATRIGTLLLVGSAVAGGLGVAYAKAPTVVTCADQHSVNIGPNTLQALLGHEGPIAEGDAWKGIGARALSDLPPPPPGTRYVDGITVGYRNDGSRAQADANSLGRLARLFTGLPGGTFQWPAYETAPGTKPPYVGTFYVAAVPGSSSGDVCAASPPDVFQAY